MNLPPTRRDQVVSIVESIVFGSRWILYPMTIGLIATMCGYSIKFLAEVYNLLVNFYSLDAEQIMVRLLGLIDMFMVANLLIMITKGSYQIFIRRFQISDTAARPQWLDHIDSGILKVKVASSVAGITLIKLLKDFVNIEHIDWTLVCHRAEIHIVCLISAVVMAVIWRVTHPKEDNAPAN